MILKFLTTSALKIDELAGSIILIVLPEFLTYLFPILVERSPPRAH